MRSLTIIFLAVLCIVLVNGSSIISREKRQDDEPVIIVDAGSHRRPFNPFLLRGVPMDQDDVLPEPPTGFGFNNFGNDFSQRLNTMLAGLQAQFNSLWKRLYEQRKDAFNPTSMGGGSNGGLFPPSYHNTTKTTKVINGSVVTVHETIDKHTDNDTLSFFHVKVIHVKPENPIDYPDVEHAEPDTSDELETPKPAVIEPEIPQIPFVTEVRDREPLKPDHPSDKDKVDELEDNMP